MSQWSTPFASLARTLRKNTPARPKNAVARLWVSLTDAVISSSDIFPFRVADALHDNSALKTRSFAPESGIRWFTRAERSVDEQADESVLPVPPKELWAGYGQTAETFLKSGETDVKKMIELLKATDFTIPTGGRVLEFGCAAGRMIRWLYPLADTCELWGVDISAPHIVWCQDYLSPPFHFATTTILPHLPFEDCSFDLILSGSVFTHISDLADAWLLELRRILRPGGRLYLTIHDAHTIDLLLNSPQYANSNLRKTLIELQEAGAKLKNFGMLAVRQRSGAEQVFYETSYLSQRWERYLDILSFTPEAYGKQTAVILAK